MIQPRVGMEIEFNFSNDPDKEKHTLRIDDIGGSCGKEGCEGERMDYTTLKESSRFKKYGSCYTCTTQITKWAENVRFLNGLRLVK